MSQTNVEEKVEASSEKQSEGGKSSTAVAEGDNTDRTEDLENLEEELKKLTEEEGGEGDEDRQKRIEVGERE